MFTNHYYMKICWIEEKNGNKLRTMTEQKCHCYRQINGIVYANCKQFRNIGFSSIMILTITVKWHNLFIGCGCCALLCVANINYDTAETSLAHSILLHTNIRPISRWWSLKCAAVGCCMLFLLFLFSFLHFFHSTISSNVFLAWEEFNATASERKWVLA